MRPPVELFTILNGRRARGVPISKNRLSVSPSSIYKSPDTEEQCTLAGKDGERDPHPSSESRVRKESGTQRKDPDRE